MVAVNCFDGSRRFSLERGARSRWTWTRTYRVMLCDARDRESSKLVLVELVEHVARQRGEPVPVG